MGMPSFRRDWQTVGNVAGGDGSGATADHQSTLLAIKNTLIGFSSNPWTVHSSSDSVATADDDLWDASTDVVWGTGAHSWIVLEHPTRDTQICIECTSTGGTVQQVGIYWSPGGNYTGGSITAKPTATDEINTPGADFIWLGNISAAFTAKVMAQHTRDGSCTRVQVCQHTSSECSLLLLCDEPANPSDDWTVPEVVLVYAQQDTGTDEGACYWDNLLDNSSFANAWGREGSTTIAMRLGTVAYNDDSSGLVAAGSSDAGSVANDLDASGAFALFPVLIASETASHKGFHGVLADCYHGPVQASVGTTYPSSTTSREWFAVESLVFPWLGDSTVPQMTGSPSGNTEQGYAPSMLDETAPTVDNFSPANGSTIEGTDPIYFDATDDSGVFRRVLVAVAQGDATELAHDGDAFLAPYDELSTRTNIAGGFRYKLRRSGGWVSDVTVTAYAIDLGANEN